mmetsp:Transcript_5405/g.7029  ORF Transcript_5405/g.7029 Transcript_5405/m.7029 type:complete len:225 (+) Transcript_5405:80-754(+)
MEDIKELRESLKNLDKQRSLIEDEIETLIEVLGQPGVDGAPGVGLSGPLVDDEGFPRADVNLYQVRQQRSRVHCLQTDHKMIMQQIESLMTKLFQSQQVLQEPLNKSSSAASTKEQSSPPSSNLVETTAQNWSSLKPFARIEGVLDGSPAHEGDLRAGDLIIRFKDINYTNSRGLQALSSVVKDNIGISIPIEIIRDGEYIDSISIQPHSWSGAGVVGCRFIPL